MKIFVRETKLRGLDSLHNIKGPMIIASNHRGRIDGVWIWYYLALMNRHKIVDIRIITGARFFEMPLIGWYLKKMRCFPVVSGKGVEVLDPMVDVLNNDGIVTIFPEGKMQKHPEQKGEAKRGVGYLVYKTHSPVLPIYINYHKKSKYLPIWDFTFVVGKIQIYDIIKDEDNLKKIANLVLSSIYEMDNK